MRKPFLFVLFVATVILASTALPAVAPQPDSPGPVALESISAAALEIAPQRSYETAVVRVVGPDRRELLRREFKPGEGIHVPITGTEDSPLADGRYAYELRLRTGTERPILQRGIFFVENQVAVSREHKREQLASVRGELNRKKEGDRRTGNGPSPLGYSAGDFISVVDVVGDGTYLQLDSVSAGAQFPYQCVSTFQGYLDFGFDQPGNCAYPNNLHATLSYGYLGIGTTVPTAPLHVVGSAIVTGDVSLGSSRDLKHETAPVVASKVLAKVLELPLFTWKYRSDKYQSSHLGPMAEDFHRRFELGRDDRHISPADSSGVALAAIQGLYRRFEEQVGELKAANKRLEEENAELEQRLTTGSAEADELRERLEALERALTQQSNQPAQTTP